jgi:hypothetical protein
MLLIRKLLFVLLAFASGVTSAAVCGNVGKIPDQIHAARVLLFGEVHGTAESPFVVGQILCRLVEREEAIALALELPVEMDQALATYLKSEGAGQDVDRLLGHAFWARPLQDGRSSVAILGLIERARMLAASGKRLTLHAVGAAGSVALARDIRAVMAKHPGAKLVALTGNAHARKAAGTSGALSFDPMGYLLRDLAPCAVSLEFDTGSAWVCVGSDCGPRPMGGRFGRSDGAYGFHGAPSLIAGYDASFQLGAVTASPPAKSALR